MRFLLPVASCCHECPVTNFYDAALEYNGTILQVRQLDGPVASHRRGGKKNQRTSASTKLAGGYAKPSSISFFDRYHKHALSAEDESVKIRSKSICLHFPAMQRVDRTLLGLQIVLSPDA
jgi:hypothetical protein